MTTALLKSKPTEACHSAETASVDKPETASGAPWWLKTAAARLNEAADDYPVILARLNARWWVIGGKCGLQWVLQRRDAGVIASWRGSAYCRTREGLMSNIRERCGEVEEAGLRAVERLPERKSS